MLKFHEIVLRKFFVVFSILFVSVGTIVYFWIEDFYISQTKNSLLNNLEIISFDLKDHSHLEIISKNIKDKLNTRLTVIAEDGTVLLESHEKKENMDNHRYRSEIMQSDREKYGYKIRHSNTLNKELLYVAKKFIVKNSIVYVRLSKELQNINEEIISLGIKTFVVLIIFLIFVFIITYKISSQLDYEIQKVVKFLSALAKKEKPNYISSDFSLEFSNITKLLTKVSQILTKKDKRKSKYTAQLQDANKQKDDIISAISHEFKNPIAVINGYSQTLLDDSNLNPDIHRKFLTKIYNNGIKLSELIDTLRLSIKLDSGSQTANFTNVNLYEMINDTVENIQINYHNRQTIINGDKDFNIKADPSLFSVVISNLVENAYKYSEDEITINFDETSIDIIDTGIGIAKKDLDNITNKFYRIHENSWNNSLGLGLFIVSNILNLHHFKLKIKSKENEGSTFSIIF